VARHTGYDGPIRFSRETIADNKPEVQKKKTDDVAQTIATLFRGEVLHLQ